MSEVKKKNRPLCPECKQPTIVLFTPPKDATLFGKVPEIEYIDWDRAHLYCCNGTTNCKYEAPIMGKWDLST